MIINVQETQVREITEFLIKSKVILHPVISPSGIPDFSLYRVRNFILILDRNILVPILDLVQSGTLKDKYKIKLIASILFWCDINGITLTSGLALMEHSHVQGNDIEAANQHNLFQSINKQYSPQDWLDLAIGKKSSIPKLRHIFKEKSNYLINNEHHMLNYLGVLKLCQLHFNFDLSIAGKMAEFHRWSYENTLIGMYLTFYATMFFSSCTKLSDQIQDVLPDQLYEKCKNVAWDLTYLSFWSTLYWNDRNADVVFLLATRDKEIKQLFKLVHSNPKKVYQKALGPLEGERVKKDLESIYKQRPKRIFEEEDLKSKIVNEENTLKNLIQENTI